jgi:DNA-directed RNA polymerase subunit RPC12/RpoP
MSTTKIIGILAAAVLFFFGIIFAIAASVQYAESRLIAAFLFFAAGFILVYYVSRGPKTVIQKLEVSGDMKAVGIKCPNCGASVDANRIKIVSGVPYATCPYCGRTFEVAEEPKW